MSKTNYHVYASGSASHVLCQLYPGHLFGQRTLSEVFSNLLGIPLGDPEKLTSVEFLKLPAIQELKPEDQIRRWIFIHQLLWIDVAFRMRYEPDSRDQILIRWNRNKTLVSTANSPEYRGKDELILDFGGGQIKSPFSTEDHDASALLDDLNSGNPEQIHRSTVRLSALVGKLVGEAAKAGHVGTRVTCLCTGKYWQEIINCHHDKFANNTFKLEWIDSEQERHLEFMGCEAAFKEQMKDESCSTVWIGNFTSGGSSSEIWLVDRSDKSGENDTILRIPFPHGSKSSMFWDKDKTSASLPSYENMMMMFQNHILIEERIADDPPLRMVSRT